MGSFGIAITEGLLGTYILFLYVEVLQASPGLIGTVLIIPRVFDAITDPAMGQISDRTRGKMGRRRPYLLFGAPVLGFLTYLIFAPPSGFNETALAWFLAIIGIAYYAAYTAVFIPYNALGIELSVEYHERTRIQTWRGIIYMIGAALPPFAWRLAQLFPDDRAGLSYVAGAMGLATTLAIWVTVWGTTEEAEAQGSSSLSIGDALRITLTNWPFLLLAACFLLLQVGLFGGIGLAFFVSAHYVFGGTQDAAAADYMGYFGIATTVAGVIGALFWGWFGVLVGKKKGFLAGLLFLMVLTLTSWFLYTPAVPQLQVVYAALTGLGFAALQVYPQSLLADVCDEDELATGARREGTYNGVVALLYKASAAICPFINGLILELSGFDETAEVQSAATLFDLRVAFAVFPAVVFLVCAICIWLYPLTEQRVRRIRAKLEARRHRAGLLAATSENAAIAGDLDSPALQPEPEES